MSTTLTARSTYRLLLRSTRLAFAGDLPLLHAARSEARNSFNANATLSPTDPAREHALKHAREVAEILRRNVVQGKDEEGEGRFSK